MKAVQEENASGTLRLFVAIAIPEPVRNAMARVQRELQALAPPHAVRWTKPEQFHLTLRFLGDVAAARVEELKAAVGAVCANAPPLRLRAREIGFFPNARSPRVIWLGIHDEERLLTGFQSRIEAAVGAFTGGRSEDPFTGHATLGRVKDLKRPDAGKLAAYAQQTGNAVLGEWTASEVEIIRSELSASGARHAPLAGFRLELLIR